MTDVIDLPLTLRVQNRDQILYEGSITSFSADNQKGKFDILSYHENFISIVREKISFVTTDGESKEMTVKSGILRVIENRIEVYLGFLG